MQRQFTITEYRRPFFDNQKQNGRPRERDIHDTLKLRCSSSNEQQSFRPFICIVITQKIRLGGGTWGVIKKEV